MQAFLDVAKQKECFYRIRVDAIEKLAKVIIDALHKVDNSEILPYECGVHTPQHTHTNLAHPRTPSCTLFVHNKVPFFINEK